MRHNDTRGWRMRGGGAVTNDVSKFRKVIEFKSSCLVICDLFLLYYLIVDEKNNLSIKKVVQNLRN